MAAPWPARPVLVLVLLLALLSAHIALCSAADSGKPSKAKAAGGRKALLAAASVDDDGEEEAPVVKPPAKKKAAAVAAAGKIKKKVGDDAKNQTAKAAGKTKKSESAAAVKGSTTKKASAKAAAGGDGVVAKVAKVPKADKATKAKGAADSAAAAKVKSSDSAKPAKVSKSGAAKAGKPAKTAKSDVAAAGAKPKKATNSTAEAGEAKPAKPGKKKAAPVVAAEGKSSAKANATAARKKEEEDPTVVDEDVAALGTEAAEDGDLISEFRDLPARLQETLMPDLARLSHSSKAYLSAANANIADGVRPILGGRWAAALASAASVALLLLPLCALTAVVRRAGAYLPLLHRALLLAQAYLAIYFATLALAAAATGLEPLRFFHAASPAAYAWTQAAQSLGFVGYLVLQMVDLVAVFSGAASPEMEDANGNGDATKALGLAQMVVGLAVGLHYYAAVFHRAATGEAPRANWRVYAVYAACFVVICACARAERRKKAYLADGAAEEWKKS